MANDPETMKTLRAIRDALVGQLIQLDELGETRAAADLSPAVERLNRRLGDAPSEEEAERLRRKYFMN
ncbi:hypothetical protein [Sphingopyxis sp. R3-92]|uniref:hypothetical protein n=1 Tax=Sphingopyxis sp. R3-92 TaxID=3158553 RepID=UPI003EE4268A